MSERDGAWQHLFPPVTRERLREDVATFDLCPAVPDDVRRRYERARSTYCASYEDYGLVAAAAEQVWLTVEMAARQRLQQAHLDQAAEIERDKQLTLRPLLQRLVSERLLSRDWDVDGICALRNHIAHAKETPTFPPALALNAFQQVAAMVNELWRSSCGPAVGGRSGAGERSESG